jgi:hypothetical protein
LTISQTADFEEWNVDRRLALVTKTCASCFRNSECLFGNFTKCWLFYPAPCL